jgi:predicted DNA-binding protein with PD1-like motif
MEVRGHRHAATALPPGNKAGAHLSGGWVVPRAGLDVFGDEETSSGRDSNSGPSRP